MNFFCKYTNEMILQLSNRLITETLYVIRVIYNAIRLVIVGIYINNIHVTHVTCSKCESVVLPKLGEQIIKGKEEVFCSRCDCKYENRNTTIIKVFISLLANFMPLSYGLYNMTENFMLQIVVIIVIWVISLLVIYMLFLICLDPLLNKRIHKASANIGYHEHNNEEVNMSAYFSVICKCTS